MLARTNLQDHERRILKMVFCATLLGTITWYASSSCHKSAADDAEVLWGFMEYMKLV